MTPGEAIERGRVAFNQGDFFAAHEHWEGAWHLLEGVPRVMVQGLIQIAAGLHHLQRGRARPAARLLGKGRVKLGAGPPSLLGNLRVASLAGDVTRLVAELDATGTAATRLAEL